MMKPFLENRILAEASVVKRNPPRNLVPSDLHYFQHEYEKQLPACKLMVLRKVAFTEQGVIYTRNLKLIEESLVAPDLIDEFRLRFVLATLVKKRKVTLDKNKYYLSAVDLWSSGYAHWILDSLPRLMACREIHKDVVLLLPATHNRPYVLEMIKMFQFKDVEFMPENTYAFVENMVLVTHAAPQGQLNITITNRLREHIWQSFSKDIERFSKGDKVYVSRIKAPKRHILNEDEVQKAVTEMGFSVVCFEDFSMAEQIAIMYHARYIVTLHGAGVSNMLFMQPGSHFLELRRREDTHNNHFFSLASAINIEYWYQLCDYQASPKASKNHGLMQGNYYDVTVDVPLMKENISKMMASEPVVNRL